MNHFETYEDLNLSFTGKSRVPVEVQFVEIKEVMDSSVILCISLQSHIAAFSSSFIYTALAPLRPLPGTCGTICGRAPQIEAAQRRPRVGTSFTAQCL